MLTGDQTFVAADEAGELTVGLTAPNSVRDDALTGVGAVLQQPRNGGAAEEELITVVADLADRIEVLQQMVAVDGERRVGKDGNVRLHSALSEIRQSEATLARVVRGIQTMEDAPKNPVQQRAAQSRWRAHNLRRAAIAAGQDDAT